MMSGTYFQMIQFYIHIHKKIVCKMLSIRRALYMFIFQFLTCVFWKFKSWEELLDFSTNLPL